MMDVHVLGRVVRVGDGSQQKLAEPALPEGTPMNQFVTHDKDRLRDHGQDAGHKPDFPEGKVVADQHLP